MYKVLLIILWITLGFYANAQRRDEGNYVYWPYNQYTDKIEFSESLNTPETSRDSLYSYAKQFAVNTYKGEKDTVSEDPNLNTVFCKGAYIIPVEEIGERGKGYISYTLTIQCRNNYYKYSLTNLVHSPLNPDGVTGGPLENDRTTSGGMLFPRQYWERQKTKCYYLIQATIEQLKQAMNRTTDS